MKGLLAVVGSLVVGIASAASACASFGVSDDANDGGVEAGACAPPACGGAGGRCAKVSACGLEFSCGDCAPPFTCVDGTCRCAGTKTACQDQRATCGVTDDGCGQDLSCGTCAAGTSCQTTDGGLACASGACIPDAPAKTCGSKCKRVTNNCGTSVSCACTRNELCVPSGKDFQCSCPARGLGLNQFIDTAQPVHLCYSHAAACPGVFQGTIARLYAAAYEGLTPLYRCRRFISNSESSYFLTTHSDCEGLPGYLVEGVIGACATTPICGAVPLYRYYRRSGNGDFVHSLAPTTPLPGAYDQAFGIACYVWQS